MDVGWCGDSVFPCKTIPYAVSLPGVNSTIKLLYNNDMYWFGSVYFNLTAKEFNILGIKETINGEELYPTILYNYSTSYLLCFYSTGVKSSFNNLTFIINSSNNTSTGNLLYVYCDDIDSYIIFKYEFFILNILFYFILFL
jgi:hypothetical protein